VARGVRPPALDDVTAVLPADAGGVQELAPSGQRVVQVVPESSRRLAVQSVGVAVEFEDDAVVVGADGRWVRGSLTVREFLDQPPRGDFRYPRRGRDRVGTSVSVVAGTPT